MKKLIILFLFLTTITYCQELYDPIPDLYSSEEHLVLRALIEVHIRLIPEAIEPIHKVMFNQNYNIQSQMLNILRLLEDPELTVYIDNFLQSLPAGNDQYKAEANLIWYLYNFGGDFYAGAEYFQNHPEADNYIFYLSSLNKALETNLEELAKTKLLEAARDHPSADYQIDALLFLCEKYGEGMNEYIIEFIIPQEDVALRLNAADCLTTNKSLLVKEWIHQNIENEPNSTVRSVFAEYIIEKYGEPADVMLIKDLLQIEPEERYQKYYESELKVFIPPPFDPDLNVIAIAEIILNHIETMINYSWIIPVYERAFSEIYNFIIHNEYPTAIEAINNLLELVNSDYEKNKITNEGYKFIHYELSYLKDILEKL
jgi:hypothetical protein